MPGRKKFAGKTTHVSPRIVSHVVVNQRMFVKTVSLGSLTSKATVLNVGIHVVNANMKLTRFTMAKSNLSWKI